VQIAGPRELSANNAAIPLARRSSRVARGIQRLQLPIPAFAQQLRGVAPPALGGDAICPRKQVAGLLEWHLAARRRHGDQFAPHREVHRLLQACLAAPQCALSGPRAGSPVSSTALWRTRLASLIAAAAFAVGPADRSISAATPCSGPSCAAAARMPLPPIRVTVAVGVPRQLPFTSPAASAIYAAEYPPTGTQRMPEKKKKKSNEPHPVPISSNPSAEASLSADSAIPTAPPPRTPAPLAGQARPPDQHQRLACLG